LPVPDMCSFQVSVLRLKIEEIEESFTVKGLKEE
jgi:hypothetical protein